VAEFEYFPLFLSRIRSIADDCFDLAAAAQLRAVVDQIEGKLSFPPIVFQKHYDDDKKDNI
jgi:hypothetical protein